MWRVTVVHTSYAVVLENNSITLARKSPPEHDVRYGRGHRSEPEACVLRATHCRNRTTHSPSRQSISGSHPTTSSLRSRYCRLTRRRIFFRVFRFCVSMLPPPNACARPALSSLRALLKPASLFFVIKNSFIRVDSNIVPIHSYRNKKPSIPAVEHWLIPAKLVVISW